MSKQEYTEIQTELKGNPDRVEGSRQVVGRISKFNEDLSVRERLNGFSHTIEEKKTVPSLNILTYISLIDKSTLSPYVITN